MASFQYDFSSTFGGLESLINRSETINVGDALNGKEVVGLYFSAHWCPPCRKFTPVLSDIYNDLKKANKSFEIVFISSDKGEKSFRNYYDTMPWLALPLDSTSLKKKLSDQFDCVGLPSLVLIDGATGQVIGDISAVTKAGAQGFPFTKEAISVQVALKSEQLLSVCSGWKLFQDHSAKDVAADCRNKEAVALFIADPGSSGTPFILKALKTAYGSLSDRMNVLFVPMSDEDSSEFASTWPSEWHIFTSEQGKLITSQLEPVTGKMKDYNMWIINGECTKMINDDAAYIVYNNEASGFPWSEEALKEAGRIKVEKIEAMKAKLNNTGLLFLEEGEVVINNRDDDGTTKLPGCASTHLLDNELIGLYFSAHWCGPCRLFTPKLVDQYKQLKEAGHSVEILFISMDEDQEIFDEYFKTMPWMALDFSQSDLRRVMLKAFEVPALPTLVWINPKTGEINKEGRTSVMYGEAYFPYTPALLAAGKAEADKKKHEEEEAARQLVLELEAGWKADLQVCLTNHRGKGTFDKDYNVQFEYFNTFGADVKLSGGKFYYEIEVVEIDAVAQFGWFTDGFEAVEQPNGEGVGDNSVSWGFDGMRMAKWNDDTEAFGVQWKVGDILGCAIDMTSNGMDTDMFFSVNGSYDAPLGLAFEGLVVKWLTPALTAQGGKYKVNFGHSPFRYSPPDDEYKSVHHAHQK